MAVKLCIGITTKPVSAVDITGVDHVEWTQYNAKMNHAHYHMPHYIFRSDWVIYVLIIKLSRDRMITCLACA